MPPALPPLLQPVAQAPLLLPSGHAVHVPVARPRFTRWTGDADHVHTFGGKDLLRVDDRPQFAEVAILRLFEAAGWQGRWVETYGNPKRAPGLWREWNAAGPRAQAHVPIEE